MSVMEKIQERFTAGIVYGEPVESEGSMVVPATRVIGGGGGGGDSEGNEGGGFGLSARPSGAWVSSTWWTFMGWVTLAVWGSKPISDSSKPIS